MKRKHRHLGAEHISTFAINFMRDNWLIATDAYHKCLCIHSTSFVNSRTIIKLLEKDFAHFGYPDTLVTSNATTFASEEFHSWCREHAVTHLIVTAPRSSCHPEKNVSAERLIQSFK